MALYFYPYVRDNLIDMGKKISFEQAALRVSERGFSLLEITTHKNSRVKILCSKHGAFEASWSNFYHRNSGCPKCKSEKTALTKILFDDLIKIANKNGFKVLLSKNEYEKSHHKKLKIPVICACGNEHKKTSFQLRNSIGCIKCRWQNHKHPTRITRKKAIQKIKNLGYEVGRLSEFKNSKTKFTAICPKHGEFFTTYNTLDQGHLCYRCSSVGSKAEQEISDFIKDLNVDFLKNDRNIIAPKELDIFIPSKNIAIEYCGLHWHHEEIKPRYHIKEKHDLCKEKDIQLITIFEDEWIKRKEQIKNTLKAKLGLLPKIYARKTQIRQIDSSIAKDYLNKWHIQGACAFIRSVGLFCDDILVGVGTLSKHHRGNVGTATISRICFGDQAVVGGSSKIVLALTKEAKKESYNNLVSWSDNRWSSGKSYELCGFERKELGPDYCYYKSGSQSRLSKQSCQKKHLKKRGGVGNTESEMANSLKLFRIYDAGKVAWFKLL